MTMEPSILRARARANLAGKWGISIGIAAVAFLLGGQLTGSNFWPSIGTEALARCPTLQTISNALNWKTGIGPITFSLRSGTLGLATFILGGVIQLGYAQLLLNQHDGKDFQFRDIFSQFDRFGTGFAQIFLRSVYTTLWSLLLVIPGIVKSYSYSMTPFILAEHPNLTASQAIELSQQMMEGHKMDLFLLNLSFIGWEILAGFSFNGIRLNFGYLFLNPYTAAARAAFYRQLQEENRYTSYA